MVVAVLKINDARFALRARPGQRLAALRMRGGEEGRHVRRHAEAPVNLVVDGEVLQPASDRMVFGDDDDRYVHVVLITNFSSDQPALAIRLRVTTADDALVIR